MIKPWCRRASILICFLTSTALIACGPSIESNPMDLVRSLTSTNTSSQNLPATAETFTERVAKTYDGQYKLRDELKLISQLHECDVQQKDSRYLIAAELDRRSTEINLFKAMNPVSNNYIREIQVGPLLVTENVLPPNPTPGYTMRNLGAWADRIADYEKIKNEPVNQKWVDLFNQVTWVLVSDQMRMVYHAYSEAAVDYFPRPYFQGIYDKVQACRTQSTCRNFDFTDIERQLFNTSEMYAILEERIRTSFSESDRMRNLDDLIYRLGRDYQPTSITPNPSIKRISPTVFQISLDPGDLSSVKDEIAEYIYKFWSGPQYRFEILWSDRKTDPKAYKLKLNPSGATFVNSGDLQMTIGQFVHSRALPHEFGHVLGLPDRYYVYFDKATCRYKQAEDRSDMMSDAYNGSIKDSDWELLDKTYPFQGP